jgi:hypothetical protein
MTWDETILEQTMSLVEVEVKEAQFLFEGWACISFLDYGVEERLAVGKGEVS